MLLAGESLLDSSLLLPVDFFVQNCRSVEPPGSKLSPYAADSYCMCPADSSFLLPVGDVSGSTLRLGRAARLAAKSIRGRSVL